MSKKSKDFIVKSLLQLLQTNKFEVITISEICDNTQIVRKTFYNNFTSKEDVIAYYSKNLIDEYYDRVKNKNSGNTQDAARFFFDFGIEYKPELKLFIDNRLYHLFGKEFKKILPEVNKLFPGNKFEHTAPEDAKYVFSFMAAGVLQILEDWIISDENKTSEDLTNLYLCIVTNIPRSYHTDQYECE
jgi:AcrR family transcriptional regulator